MTDKTPLLAAFRCAGRIGPAEGGIPEWVRFPEATIGEMRRSAHAHQGFRRDRPPKTRYERYIQSRHWRMFRSACLALANWQCNRCDDKASHLHHLHYRTLGKEMLFDVEPLCAACHELEHEPRETA